MMSMWRVVAATAVAFGLVAGPGLAVAAAAPAQSQPACAGGYLDSNGNCACPPGEYWDNYQKICFACLTGGTCGPSQDGSGG